MTIIGLIIFLAVIGFVLWLVNTKIPMQPWIKTVLNVAVLIIVLLVVLNVFGLLGELNRPVPQIR